MAFNILDLFRAPAPGQVQQPTAPVTPAPTGSTNPGTPMPGTAASPGTAPNGVVPAGAGESGANDPQSELSKFAKLWETIAADPNKQGGPIFAKLDPAKVMESAKGVDFSKGVSQELLAKISAGGPEAVTAMMTAMNGMSQSVFGQGAITNARLIDEALSKQKEQIMAELPALVRQQAVSENLQKENPAMNNPALKPLVGALQAQLSAQYPNASAAEIQQQVVQYFNTLGAVFGPKTAPAADKDSSAASGSFNFASFLPPQ